MGNEISAPEGPLQRQLVHVGFIVTGTDLCGVRVQDEMRTEQTIIERSGVSAARLRQLALSVFVYYATNVAVGQRRQHGHWDNG
jgi:hypothetical protein